MLIAAGAVWRATGCRALSSAASGSGHLSADDCHWTTQVRISTRWGDMDAFQHVNNAVYFKFFEDARIQHLDDMGLSGNRSSGVILAETSCKYVRPLFHPDTVVCKIRTTELGVHFWKTETIVCSEKLGGQIAAVGTAKIVFFDYAKNAKTQVPPHVRQRLEQELADLAKAQADNDHKPH